jgi:indole-3-glycerol phosphate synthase
MGFLEEVVAENRAAIDRPTYLVGVPATRPAGRASLAEIVRRRPAEGALLVEYKRISPGRADADLPHRTLSQFVSAAAVPEVAGFSCLASIARFDGRPADVADLVRLSDRPVLFKDFVVGSRQLEAAERSGASAVLLVARLEGRGLLDRPLRELAAEAHRRHLEVLLELHAEAELSEVDGVAADMFGVNVRDLDSLRLDAPTARNTIRAARRAGLGPIVGLSGVESAEDARSFWAEGVDGILVGTGFARAPHPGEFLRSLVRPPATGAR